MIPEYTKDIIIEMINIGVAKGAASLASMMNTKVQLSIPNVEILKLTNIKDYFSQVDKGIVSAIIIDFENPSKGKAIFNMTSSDAEIMVKALSIDDGLQDQDVLREVGNIVLNGIIASISQFISLSYLQEIPMVFEGNYYELHKTFKSYSDIEFVIICKTNFEINYSSGMEGEILIFSDSILKYANRISQSSI